jgi:hypothetical protein
MDGFDLDRLDEDLDDADDGARQHRRCRTGRGRYETWRSIDPLHSAFMDALAAQADDTEEARLWLAVLDQALVDHFLGAGRPYNFDPEDWRWQAAGWDVRFLGSQRCRDIVELIGVDWDWFRELLDRYAAHRRQEVAA